LKKIGHQGKTGITTHAAWRRRKTWANVDALIMDFDYCPNTSIKDSVSAFIDWYKTYDKGEFSVSNCSGQ
tara:strand:+ start:1406 stop:1615 length:210 start_codon:yes stop_codon:yes gene_type:complete